MVDLAGDDARLAGAADALEARAEHRDAVLTHDLEDRLVGRHREAHVGLLEDDVELGVVRVVDLLGREALDVGDERRARAALALDGFEQTLGATRVDERGALGLDLVEHALQVEGTLRVLGPDRHLVAVLGELVAEGHRRLAAAEVVQVPVLPGGLDLADHRHDRRDADAPGDEDVRGRLAQFEVVARAVADEFVAGLERVVDVGGAAARLDLAQHRDAVAGAVGHVTAEGVLADRLGERVVLGHRAGFGGLHLGRVDAAQDEVEVRAGRPRRQVAAVLGPQGEETDAVGSFVDGVDDEQGRRFRLGRFRDHALLLRLC